MKKLPLLTLPLLLGLSACNSAMEVTPTTEGKQLGAPVSRIAGEVKQTVSELHLDIAGKTISATITPPPPLADGTPNTAAYSTFSLPLPTPLPDDTLTRFYTVFSPANCKRDLTGDFYARIHVVTALKGGETPYVSVNQVKANAAVTISNVQAAYIYSDRTTYLRGTVICQKSQSGATVQDVTGFELNLAPGWNRVLITQSLTDAQTTTTYATMTRSTTGTVGTVVSSELWLPQQ